MPKRISQTKRFRADIPLARAFLEALGEAYPDSRAPRVRENADRTIDGQLEIHAPPMPVDKIGNWLLVMEQVYRMIVERFASIADAWWLRLGARFSRSGLNWRSYKLSAFRGGLEQQMTHTVRHLDDAGDVWATLREVIANVLNAYLEPNPQTGRMRPEYHLKSILIHIHGGAERPLY